MHVLMLPLETTEYDEQVIRKRFGMIGHLHNVMVKQAKKRLVQLKYDKVYADSKAKYGELLKKQNSKDSEGKPVKLSAEERALKRKLSQTMSDIRLGYGLSKSAFESYLKGSGKQFRKHISSQQVQKEAERVWRGAEKVIFGNGEELHFKRFRNFNTICGKSNKNGVRFDKETFSIEWLGLNIKCRLPRSKRRIERDMPYIIESLNHDISYCEIKRMMFPNGWHYYLNIYLDGDAPKKIAEAGSLYNTTGIDIGTSTIASASETKLTLKELAPKCKDYNKKIRKLQEHLDMSKRASNPQKFKEDGTIGRSNHDRWVFSHTYFKNRDKLKSLYRQKSQYMKQSHEEYVNELLKDSTLFLVEKMSFSGLAKRSKKIERQEKVSDVKQKDGTLKQVRKFKRKRRFGSSMNNRAPALMIQILTRKAELYGGTLLCVDTQKFRASQYDHVDDDYKKMLLKDRDKVIGGHKVQRDLYSAFLISNSDDSLEKPDREKCIYGFDRFLKMQSELIAAMKENNVTMRRCFGF